VGNKSVYEQWLDERDYHGPDLRAREEASRQLRNLAGPETRLLAFLVDIGVSIAVSIPGIGLMIGAAVFVVNKGEENTAAWLFLAGYALILVATTVVGLYSLVLLWRKGQTIGKRAMGIRIVKLDGSDAGFIRAVVLRLFIPGLLSVFTGGIFFVVDCCFIFREDRRCVHDLIAGTKVLRA
jgi:uncharacterized RDD family membrane protein YckC